MIAKPFAFTSDYIFNLSADRDSPYSYKLSIKLFNYLLVQFLFVLISWRGINTGL